MKRNPTPLPVVRPDLAARWFSDALFFYRLCDLCRVPEGQAELSRDARRLEIRAAQADYATYRVLCLAEGMTPVEPYDWTEQYVGDRRPAEFTYQGVTYRRDQ
jgi:hypothetical protein